LRPDIAAHGIIGQLPWKFQRIALRRAGLILHTGVVTSGAGTLFEASIEGA